MLNFDYTLNITKPKVILQKQQDYLTKGNGIKELAATACDKINYSISVDK